MASMQDPRAKLARASEHIELFASEIRNFVNPDRYIISHEFDMDTRKQIWRFDSPTPTIPVRLSTIVGDVLFNFRSALDQLVYQLVLANGRVPSRRNSFPIFLAWKFESKSQRALEGVSSKAITLIERSQPIPGKNWELLFLPNLNNIDKHRHLHLCLISVKEVTANLSLEDMLEVAPFVHLGRVKKGTILCTVPIKYVDMKYRPTFDIRFSESHGSESSVLTILKSIEKTITNIFSELEIVKEA